MCHPKLKTLPFGQNISFNTFPGLQDTHAIHFWQQPSSQKALFEPIMGVYRPEDDVIEGMREGEVETLEAEGTLSGKGHRLGFGS